MQVLARSDMKTLEFLYFYFKNMDVQTKTSITPRKKTPSFTEAEPSEPTKPFPFWATAKQ